MPPSDLNATSVLASSTRLLHIILRSNNSLHAHTHGTDDSEVEMTDDPFFVEKKAILGLGCVRHIHSSDEIALPSTSSVLLPKRLLSTKVFPTFGTYMPRLLAERPSKTW